jgi:hypothetical protein
MDEYSALAQRVAMTMDDVRGCLVLSRDGLVLGAFPEESETTMKPAWLRFVNVGEARRSFVEFGDQIWAYIFRGPYAAFVISGTSVRPGVLLDQLEMALLTAEEARQKRDTLRVPEAPNAPSGKPRTSLHPPATDRPVVEVAAGPPPVEAAAAADPPVVAGGPPESSPFADILAAGGGRDHGAIAEPATAVGETADAGAGERTATAEGTAVPTDTPASSFPRAPQKLVGDGTPSEPSEIDRVLLAKEFGGLLQADSEADEASP